MTQPDPAPTASAWTPQWIVYAALHIGSIAGLIILVAVHTVTWTDVQAPFYGLIGLGIGLPLTLPAAKVS